MRGAQESLPGLTTSTLGRCFQYYETLDSTNDFLKEHGRELPDGTAVIAGYQTAGKGRRGRGWSGERGKYLAMSVLLRPAEPGGLAVLPLLAGLGVSRALETVCGTPFPLKWSNDVLCGDKKVCGILCEGRTGPDGGFAVIGVGVNLLQSEEDFSRHGLVYAQSLFLATGKSHDFFRVGAEILNGLEPILKIYRAEGFSGRLREDYKQRCRTLGREVLLWDGDERIPAAALDIGEDGSLVCSVAGEIRRVNAGEVSVRGLYGYV